MKTVIEMAREAGLMYHIPFPSDSHVDVALCRFAELVRADERAECAKVCDNFEREKWESIKNIGQNGGHLAFAGPMHCAAAIRARGNT